MAETPTTSEQDSQVTSSDNPGPLTLEGFIADRGEALMRVAYLITGSHSDAEDLLQDVFVDCHRKWDRVSGSGAPYAYVRAMLANRYTSSRRRKWVGERPTDPEDFRSDTQATPDATASIDTRDQLWRLLEGLPPRMRAVLVLRYFEDLDDEAIASTLGISASTVRATASRALGQLRQSPDIHDDLRGVAS